MTVPSKSQLARFAAVRADEARQMTGRLGDMTPGPGQFAVTIRIERPDGQFVTTTTLVPGDMLTSGDRRDTQSAETARVMAGFVSAYRRAAELPG